MQLESWRSSHAACSILPLAVGISRHDDSGVVFLCYASQFGYVLQILLGGNDGLVEVEEYRDGCADDLTLQNALGLGESRGDDGLPVSGVKGDGIQAEATKEGDEFDGQVMLRGGTLNVSVTERDVAAIKADSLIYVSAGNITINTTGDGNKGLKSKDDLEIVGGELSITQSGKYIVVNNDPGYVVGIKADGDLDISGGSITINNTAEAGKGLSADGNITTSEESAELTINIQAKGSGAALDLSRNVDDDSGSGGGDGGDDPDDPDPVYRICAALNSTTSQY